MVPTSLQQAVHSPVQTQLGQTSAAAAADQVARKPGVVAAAAAAPAEHGIGQLAARLASRTLLQQFFDAYPASIDVSTVFAMPDRSSSAAARAAFVETVVSYTAETLDSPLSHFYGVSEVMVKAVQLVKLEAATPVAAAAAAGNRSANAFSSQTPAAGMAAMQGTPQSGSTDATGSASAATPAVPLAETAAAGTAAAAAAAGARPWDHPGKQHSFANYRVAPACPFPPSKSNSVSDSQGRFWSWNWGVECVFRAPAAGQTDKPLVVDWDTAVTCDDVPNEHNSVVDDSGRLWGWQNDASCAYRQWGKGSSSSTTAQVLSTIAADASARLPMKPQQQQGQKVKAPAKSFEELQGNLPTRVSVVWESAATCSFAPNDANAVPDTFGRLWGWEDNSSCAFRVSMAAAELAVATGRFVE
jgi:hypothetical protein